MAFVSIHSRITTIAELTTTTISWITHHISHLSYKINVKGIWMLAEETGLEPARRCRRTVFQTEAVPIMLTLPYACDIFYAHPLTLGHPFSATGRPHYPVEQLSKMLSYFLRDAPGELPRRPGYLLWHMTSILACSFLPTLYITKQIVLLCSWRRGRDSNPRTVLPA